MMTSEPTKPWFRPDQQLAVADLWSVYREHFDETWQWTLSVARSDPEFSRILRPVPQAEIDRQQQASRAAHAAAFEQNDWQPYEEFLRMQARVYAELGLEFEAWYRIAEAGGDVLTPHLVARFSSEPARLAAAGKALRHFLGRVMALMVRVFFEEKRRALADSERQLRALAGRLEAAREEERTRISREIHDELGQRLTALKMEIGWVTRKLTERDVQPALQRLAAMSELVDSTVKCVRQLATELRPPVLDDLGLKEAVEWLGDAFHERSGISVHIDASGWPDEEHPDVATALFRCLQELLTNVARHANATHVTATLHQRDGRAVLCVTDDGRGISADERAGQSSLGLVGVRERAAALDGTFEIRARPEGGTVATVTLPVGAP